MLKVYGTEMCPDCVNCKRDLEQAGVKFIYLNIMENMLFLKQFLKLRDENEIFLPVKARGQIGIPCILDDAGKVSLTWEEYLG